LSKSIKVTSNSSGGVEYVIRNGIRTPHIIVRITEQEEAPSTSRKRSAKASSGSSTKSSTGVHQSIPETETVIEIKYKKRRLIL